MRKFEDLVKIFSEICNQLKIPYAIVGGVAVSAWGNIRTTRDIDIILDIKPKKIKKFLKM
jgi:ribosomal protein L7Ae-like RNA K-turn-binding protein